MEEKLKFLFHNSKTNVLHSNDKILLYLNEPQNFHSMHQYVKYVVDDQDDSFEKISRDQH